MGIIKVKKVYPDAQLPVRATPGAAGTDLFAYIPVGELGPGEVRLMPRERKIVGTGIAVELPIDYELQIRPRSGLAYKQGITVLNTPGTIDSDYRGEVKVLLINHGDTAVHIRHGERIAQGVVSGYCAEEWEEMDELNDTQRGAGGFGSTDGK